MKTDKELLELAANAAFNASAGYCDRGIATGKNGSILISIWNPLTDDGDAFRLAVELSIDFYSDGEKAGAWISDSVCLTEDFRGDAYAATRRAIVRAAAAIGESK